MIFDSIANIGQYAGVHHRFKQVIEFLNSNDASQLEPGKYEIDGTHLFALVQQYETKLKDNSIWEAHKKYFDIQYIVKGEELMGHAPIAFTEVTTPYKDDSDYALFAANGSYILVPEGYFTFFAPQDVHMPCVAVSEPASVKKIVFKLEI